MNQEYQKLSDQIKRIVEQNQTVDLSELLDFSELADDPYKLSVEIGKQSALNAYFHALHKEALRKKDLYNDKLQLFRSKKTKTVVEMLKSDGVKIPTAKMIESKLLEVFDKNELYAELQKRIEIWNKRVDDCLIAINALNVREQSFRSISYMMDSMIKSGLMYPKKHQKKLED